MGRKWIFVIGSLVVLLSAGAWFGDKQLKKREHPGLVTFIKQWARNYPASFAVEPIELAITVSDKDMAELERMVEEARERGVILPEGRDYVPATLSSPDGTFKAKVRIKGKMTDHVKGSKWSFRVVAKKDGGFLGMQRFSLQHPGTRNYLCDWFYHRLSAGEGIAALRYGFIRVTFNGEDLGVYAYEEHFGPELLAHNGRVKGPLFRFDPSLFWVHRLNEMNKVRYDEPFEAYQSAALDAFGSSDLEKDKEARALFAEACGLMDGFRRGDLKASEVFNVELIARRHALLDLVGGHHSMDWSDVKFYYDPVLKRIEPVSYESFSAHHIEALAGSWRFVGRQGADQDLHDAYFNDPDLFRAYVHALERMARPSYLDSAFAALAPALDSAAAIVYREFPYKELDRSIYYHNQEIIRRLLDVPKGFHAHEQQRVGDTLVVMAVPVEALPMEVKGVVLADGTLAPPVGRSIVPCRKPNSMGAPMALRFVLPAGKKWPEKEPQLKYGVLGASVTKELSIFPQALPLIAKPLLPLPMTLAQLRAEPMLAVDEALATITIRPGNWALDHDLSFPQGFIVTATAPLRIDLRNGARLISRSPTHIKGLEESNVVIFSSDGTGGGVRLLDTGRPSTLSQVRFEGFGSADSLPAVVFSAADVIMEDCQLAEDGGRDLLMVVRGTLRMERVTMAGGRDQLTLAYVQAMLSDVLLNSAADEALVVHGGRTDMNNVRAIRTKGVGVKASNGAALQMDQCEVDAVGNGIELEKGSMLNAKGGSIRSGSTGIRAGKEEQRHGPCKVDIKGTAVEGGKAPFHVGKGADVKKDGNIVQADPGTAS
jgi:hypothetical protein